MNFHRTKKLFGMIGACTFFTLAGHQMIYAAPEAEEISAEPETEIAAEEVALSSIPWIEETASVPENAVQTQEEVLAETAENAEAEEQGDGMTEEQSEETLRQEVVEYALSFLGGRYSYGGSDPHTGVDCSGFTRYVMLNGAGVSIGRSSGSQAGSGRSISAEEMQPGDLIFYAKGNKINHVAMYIGDGQVVHASTEKTGIKTSPWTYRNPVKIVSVLG